MSTPLLSRALALVEQHEGGFTFNPNDPGGATNRGISLRYLRTLGVDMGDVDHDGDIDADDIRLLPWDLAATIYTTQFWDRYRYFRLPDVVAVKMLDLAVNMGPSQAHRLLQRALRSCAVDVEEDGVLGPETTRAAGIVPDPVALLAALRSEAAGFYRVLVATKAWAREFERGWLARAYS